MASHRKTAKDANKTILIQIAVTPEEHETLNKAAIAEDRSLRGYVKWSALKAARKLSREHKRRVEVQMADKHYGR